MYYHKTKAMNKFTGLTPSQQGYKVKDGRLMNLAPDGQTGIAQAANMRRSIKNAKKINQIAEGIVAAERRKDMFL